MKVFLTYDEQGTITSGAIVAPEFSDQIELIPENGQGVMETTLKELGIHAPPTPESDQHLVSQKTMTTIKNTVSGFRFDEKSGRLAMRGGDSGK